MTQITTVQLRELVPKVDLIAVLINPTFPVSAAQLRDAQEAAAAVGSNHGLSAENECEPAFATLVAQRADALMIAADPFFNSRRQQLVALAARYRRPAGPFRNEAKDRYPIARAAGSQTRHQK